MSARQGIIKKATRKNNKSKYKAKLVIAQHIKNNKAKTVKHRYISKKKGKNGKYVYKY